MPSTNITNSNSLIVMGELIFSFGGKLPDPLNYAIPSGNFKYDITSNQWTQIVDFNQIRYLATLVQLSAQEIFITGEPSNSKVIDGA